MGANAYRLIGYVVWRGGKWYLRQRLPSPRKIAAATVASASGAVAVAVIARRIAGSAGT
jgi:hypothetical protein